MPSGDRRYECCSIDEDSSGWWLKNDMNCRPGEKNHISNIIGTVELVSKVFIQRWLFVGISHPEIPNTKKIPNPGD